MEGKKRKRKNKTSSGSEGAGSAVDRVTYSEAVRVNLADYEHRDFFCSVSLNLGPNETLDDGYKRAKGFVTKKLYPRERKARLSAKDDVDFDTMARMIG